MKPFRQHQFAVSPAAARQLAASADSMQLLRRMQTGDVAGIYCANCGISVQELCQASVMQPAVRDEPDTVHIGCADRPLTILSLRRGSSLVAVFDALAGADAGAVAAMQRDIADHLEKLRQANGGVYHLI